jgi:hypothetical protein
VGKGTFQKLRGAFGFGLSRNIQQGYAYLALTYEPVDEIFLFGFSRGAYTARSLAGLSGNVASFDEVSCLSCVSTIQVIGTCKPVSTTSSPKPR